jgi:hypothetical protein
MEWGIWIPGSLDNDVDECDLFLFHVVSDGRRVASCWVGLMDD